MFNFGYILNLSVNLSFSWFPCVSAWILKLLYFLLWFLHYINHFIKKNYFISVSNIKKVIYSQTFVLKLYLCRETFSKWYVNFGWNLLCNYVIFVAQRYEVLNKAVTGVSFLCLFFPTNNLIIFPRLAQVVKVLT